MSKYTEIKTAFEQSADPRTAESMSRYMREQFPFYGLPAPKRKQLCKELLKQEKKNKVIDWDFLNECYADYHREFPYLVIDYLHLLQSYITYDDVPTIKKYIQTRPWWDTIDGFDSIVGDIAFADDRIPELMLEWSKDDDFWIRRIAIDHQLCRKDKTDTALLEQILVNNFGSDEFFINKAIGWSLREYSKTDPEWVRNFLERYQPQMSRLSVSEASKYI